jgi:diguanylate cyclase (GGDEF)-like protein
VQATVPKILIVDDTPQNIDVLAATLDDLGAEIMAATTGARGIELALRTAPDLVLLDVMMPGLDGFEVCRRLKADAATAEIPVIFVTARTDDVSTGFGAGGADYITKPINADEVRARVRYQLERRAMMRELRELNQGLEEKVRERTAELTLANRHLRQEINERRYVQERLNYLAMHDPVTRLYNRSALDAHIAELLGRVQREDTQAHFLQVDIDQFRLLNETCGFAAGDAMLRQFAEVVGALLSREDYFARLGGDRFAIVREHAGVPEGGSDDDPGVALARRIMERIAEVEFQWEERTFRIAACIAVVPVRREIATSDQLLAIADEVAYAAHREGRGTIRLRDPRSGDGDGHRDSVNWAPVLVDALKQDHFRAWFQRLHPVGSGAKDGLHVETLIRLWDPHRERLIPPGQFISPAERFHLIADIDRWMIREVIRVLGTMPSLHAAIGSVAVNLSAVSIREAGLAAYIAEQLREHDVPGSMMTFEITETEAIIDLQGAAEFMKTVQALGCRFSLDDFGSGFATFTYLRQLPFDTIKIDATFVRDMDGDSVHGGMVRSMAEMARLLDRPVVAEGVENERVAAMLPALGIEWAQGYHFHRPEPLTADALSQGLTATEPSAASLH